MDPFMDSVILLSSIAEAMNTIEIIVDKENLTPEKKLTLADALIILDEIHDRIREDRDAG